MHNLEENADVISESAGLLWVTDGGAILRSHSYRGTSQTAMTRNFDLNIEKILEGWEVRHAVRELIANALDEEALTGTADVTISRTDERAWTIRDLGRGLRYENLTQNENEEKLRQPGKVIGKFGVGLKDALATLNRRDVQVRIRSRYGEISLSQMSKHGFSDVITLHAAISPPAEADFVGTEVHLLGVTQDEMEAAKDFFLRFSAQTILEETPYGHILRRDPNRAARIYVTGLLVAEEDNFAFSYNITSLTASMRRALNRERTNVGRTAYTDRVKAMLLTSKASEIASILAEDLVKIERGTQHDEVQWSDVAVHACQNLNTSRKVVFVTAAELAVSRDAVDQATADGYQVVTIPDGIRRSLTGLSDVDGNPVRDLAVFQREQAERFQFEFVPPDRLTALERQVYAVLPQIIAFGGGLPKRVKLVLISEQLCPDLLNGTQTQGLWDPANGRIIIKRSQLASLGSFAGTLLHEITHARTGYLDVTREFETALTELLGRVSSVQLQSTRLSIAQPSATGVG